MKAEDATKRATQAKVCGFSDFAALEAAMTTAANGYTYKVVHDPDAKGPPTKWGPTGEPPPLGPPPAVGTCRLHATNVFVHRYELRDRARPVAEVWDSGVVLKAPGFSFDGVAVGSRTDDVLRARGADKLTCNSTGIGNFCRFSRAGALEAPGIDYLVGGTIEQTLEGKAAVAFFRGKRIAGINFDRW